MKFRWQNQGAPVPFLLLASRHEHGAIPGTPAPRAGAGEILALGMAAAGWRCLCWVSTTFCTEGDGGQVVSPDKTQVRWIPPFLWPGVCAAPVPSSVQPWWLFPGPFHDPLGFQW